MRQLARDGVVLFFDEEGGGYPPIVLIHGWCCDHSFLAPQFEHLRRDHRVIAVDLRGHGRSDKPRQEYTIEGFADDVAWLCRELDVRWPVLIGHSMGGVVSLDLAARYPELPSAVIALDSPICLPAGRSERLSAFAATLTGDDYLANARRFVANMFLPNADSPERKARIVEHMTAMPHHVMVSAIERMLAFDSAAAAQACRVPVLAIGSASPPSDFVRFRELCPQLTTGQTVGAGHFHQLEVPDQVNAMIDRFLAVALTSPAGAR